MTGGPPIVEIRGVIKQYGGLRPLRLTAFDVAQSDRIVLSGLDRQAAEMFMHLVTGAALPDEGVVRIAGTNTRDISTDTDWLLSLDRFGIVTHRSVLLESLPVAANMALPITLAVEPMAAEVRAQVEALADEVELSRERLDQSAARLDAPDKLRLHLARALASGPGLLLLEHPTAELGDLAARAAFGRTLAAVSERRALGWIAISEDAEFAKASGGVAHRLRPASGEVTREHRWWSWR